MTSTKETFRQTMSILPVLFDDCSVSISIAWVGPTLKKLLNSNEHLTLNADQSSWIASLPYLGSIFGVFLSAFLLDIVGRVFILRSCAVIHLITWFTILLTNSIPILYVARFAIGIAIGTGGGVYSVYIGEISSPKNRSRFGFAMNIFYYSGFFLEYIVATYFPYYTTALFSSIMEVFFTLSTLLLVESPQFLLMKNKYQQAEKNFMWLKGLKNSNDEVKKELEKFKNNAYNEASKKSSYFKLLTYPANYKSLLIIIFFSLLKGFIGYFPVMFFAPTVFTSSEVLTLNEFFIILGVFQVVWAIFLVYIVNCFHRRSILVIACIVTFFCHTLIAYLNYMEEHNNHVPYFPWLMFFSLTLFTAAHCVINSTALLIRGELLPLSIKPLGNCIFGISFAASGFISTKIFLLIKSSYGVYVNFLIFSIVSLTMGLFAYFIIPETRNQSLIEIQERLENRNNRSNGNHTLKTINKRLNC